MRSRQIIRYIVINFIFLHISFSYSQKIKNKTDIKIAIESGAADLHENFGNGLIYRGILRWQTQLRFSRSNLEMKGRFSPEYLDVDAPIKSTGYQGDLSYRKLFSYHILQLDASFNHQTSEVDSFRMQVLDEWQIQGLFNYKISPNMRVELKDNYLSREMDLRSKINFTKNKVSLSLAHQNDKNRLFLLGTFWENQKLSESDTLASREHYGLELEYQWRKKFIVNFVYQLGFYIDKNYYDHQLNFLGGKYLSKRWSLFLSVFYTWINENKDKNVIFNRVELFNNIHLKLAYDFTDHINIYLKAALEDHKLVDYRKVISSKQALLGIQYKF